MSNESFESMLTGGHPNSLGRTLEVVDAVLAKPDKLEALFKCYFSANETVRLRTSNALKRISREQLEWLIPYIDRLLEEISQIDQASTKWTLAQLFESLEKYMTEKQKLSAISILKDNLATHSDWIVLNTTIETLGKWAKIDSDLKAWLSPQLERLSQDDRKSVAARAKNYLKILA